MQSSNDNNIDEKQRRKKLNASTRSKAKHNEMNSNINKIARLFFIISFVYALPLRRIFICQTLTHTQTHTCSHANPMKDVREMSFWALAIVESLSFTTVSQINTFGKQTIPLQIARETFSPNNKRRREKKHTTTATMTVPSKQPITEIWKWWWWEGGGGGGGPSEEEWQLTMYDVLRKLRAKRQPQSHTHFISHFAYHIYLNEFGELLPSSVQTNVSRTNNSNPKYRTFAFVSYHITSTNTRVALPYTGSSRRRSYEKNSEWKRNDEPKMSEWKEMRIKMKARRSFSLTHTGTHKLKRII